MNKLLSAIVGVIIGLAIGWSMKSSPQPVEQPYVEVSTDQGLQKLRDLADTELSEYYKLKSMEEKYKKADELLARMLTIFLADLGLKLSHETIAASENPAPLEVTSNSLKSESAAPTSVQPLAKAGVPAPALSTRQLIADLRSPEDIEEFLKQSVPADFESALKSATGYQNRSGNLQALNGFFIGSANVMKDNKPAVWRINFRFNGRIDNGKLKGNHTVRMFENGQEFSNKSGNGHLDEDYLELPSDPQATIIETGPDAYLQIYYLKQSDSIIGNVIKRMKRGRGYETIGRLNLLRDS